jgi:hypothetical protein
MVIDDRHLLLHFNEKLEPHGVSDAVLEIMPHRMVASWSLLHPMLQQLDVHMGEPLIEGTSYEVQIRNISDCSGNPVVVDHNAAVVYLPEDAEPGDIIFTEVLFDPRPGGVEFVEIYNRSDKQINLRNWSVALEKDGIVYRQVTITGKHLLHAPGAYKALTKDAFILKGDYPSGRLDHFVQVPDMPQLNDAGGTLVLFDPDGLVIDRFSYEPGFHHPWLDDTEGISLERIDLQGETNNPGNWSSASADHAFATPGMRNSQFYLPQKELLSIDVHPQLIVPGSIDTRGVAEISYTCGAPGQMATIEIFDIAGRMVKTITENANIAGQGSFQWHGRNDHGQFVDMGYYIVRVETFGLNGEIGMIKETIAVGRKYTH